MVPQSALIRFGRHLVWLYLLLILFEGALRKWVVPGLANPLLIVRDPVAVALYLLAFRLHKFPLNGFVAFSFLLAVLSFAFSMLGEVGNLFVTLYGIRINYLHIPMIFVVPQFMDREDVLFMGKVLLCIAPAMTVLVALQFFAPQTHFLNRQIGGTVGIGITGALGRFRPSGTFSFVTGIAAFYPIVTAFLVAFLLHRGRSSVTVMSIAAMSILVAVPFSISRSLAIACGIVLVVGGLALISQPNSPKYLGRLILVAAVVALALPSVTVLDEGVKTFDARWSLAQGGDSGNTQGAIVGRFFHDLMEPIRKLESAPILGYGIGLGSNVGAKHLTGKTGFLMGEHEWGRCIYELGPLVGVMFVAIRIGLTLYLLRAALRALRRGNALPLLLFSSIGLLVLQGQWGPPTILGFAALGGGLVLAAAREPSPEKVAAAMAKAAKSAEKKKRHHRHMKHLSHRHPHGMHRHGLARTHEPALSEPDISSYTLSAPEKGTGKLPWEQPAAGATPTPPPGADAGTPLQPWDPKQPSYTLNKPLVPPRASPWDPLLASYTLDKPDPGTGKLPWEKTDESVSAPPPAEPSPPGSKPPLHPKPPAQPPLPPWDPHLASYTLNEPEKGTGKLPWDTQGAGPNSPNQDTPQLPSTPLPPWDSQMASYTLSEPEKGTGKLPWDQSPAVPPQAAQKGTDAFKPWDPKLPAYTLNKPAKSQPPKGWDADLSSYTLNAPEKGTGKLPWDTSESPYGPHKKQPGERAEPERPKLTEGEATSPPPEPPEAPEPRR